jgi:hypothetical protein
MGAGQSLEPNLECECKFRASFDDDFVAPLAAVRGMAGELRPLGNREKLDVYFERDGRLRAAGLALRCNRRPKGGLRFCLKQTLELRGPLRIAFEHVWDTGPTGLNLADPFERRLPVLAPVLEAAFSLDERDDVAALSELKPVAKVQVARTAWLVMWQERPTIALLNVLLDRVCVEDLRCGSAGPSRFSELEIELDQEYPRAYEIAEGLSRAFAGMGYVSTIDGKWTEILR